MVTNADDLVEAFDATGRDLTSAPLGQLPVFSVDEVNSFFGDLVAGDLVLRPPN